MALKTELDALLREMAEGHGPVLKSMAQMSAGALDDSGIDVQTGLLVRFAALVALDAAPISYLIHLGLADEAGIAPEAVRGTLVALAPLVGTARVVSAAGKIGQALEMAARG